MYVYAYVCVRVYVKAGEVGGSEVQIARNKTRNTRWCNLINMHVRSNCTHIGRHMY